MSQPIVLAFHHDGDIEYTRNKDFTPFGGRGEMRRVTDIRKMPDVSSYYIHWTLGPHRGSDHSYNIERLYRKASVFKPGEGLVVIRFPSYEAAVYYEITLLNAMRLQGVRFDEQTQR